MQFFAGDVIQGSTRHSPALYFVLFDFQSLLMNIKTARLLRYFQLVVLPDE